jgi:hypothetical protein
MGAYSVELSTVTRAELYTQAQLLGVPGRSRMNKDELARAVGERDRQLDHARARCPRSWPRAATPAVFRTLAWRSVRMVPPLAGVMLSAAIGATTAMLLVDSPGGRGAVMRVDLPVAYAQPAAQPKAIRAAASTPALKGVSASRGAAPTMVLAEASGDSSTGMPSAPQQAGNGTEAPPGGSGPTPSAPQPGDGDEPGGGSEDPDGSRGGPGYGDESGETGPRDEASPSDRFDRDADESGKGKGPDKGKGHDKRKGKSKGEEDPSRDNGHDKGKDGDNGKGNDGKKGEG